MTTLNYLGKHTAIAHLVQADFSTIPYLKDNKGALPPFVFAVGDARRIDLAIDVLKLTNVVKLHDKAEKLLGRKARGRIDLVLGTYTHHKKSLPLVLVETQMGMPATEINLREVCANCHTSYVHDKKTLTTKHISVIRVGTAGAINNPEAKSPAQNIAVGDVVNATFSIGWAGTLLESLGGIDYSSPETLQTFTDKWFQAGNTFTADGKFPLVPHSKNIIDNINKAAQQLKIKTVCGGNFSKDSLYAEVDEEAFINLRKKYNVLSTEMEQMALGKLVGDFQTAGISLQIGLVSGIIGVIPGVSFAKDNLHEAVEKKAIRVAARALWNTVYL